MQVVDVTGRTNKNVSWKQIEAGMRLKSERRIPYQGRWMNA